MTTAEYNYCVYRFAWSSVKIDDEAKDITQNALMTLWEKRQQVTLEKAKNFLFTVAHRRCMDYFRDRQNNHTTLEQALTYSIDHTNTAYDLKSILHKALQQLDQQSKQLVLLKDYEGYNYEEIGQITELSPAQVKVYLHRARQQLRSYLVSIKKIV
jgi:RNA polymerase sigma factor (sigma-70 family)